MNSVVVITGAARGIGRRTAEVLGAAGHRLVLIDDGSDLTGTAADPLVLPARLKSHIEQGHVATGLSLDVAAEDAPSAIVDHAIATFGRIDALVSCAGLCRDGGLMNLSGSDYRRVVDVQLLAPIALCQAAARSMVAQKTGGSLVLFTGPQGFFGAARKTAAAAASGGVAAFVRSGAVELRRHGIQLNAIAPTARTRQTEASPLFQKLGPDSLGTTPVAEAVRFLLAPEAKEVSGEIVGVAGHRIYALRSKETTGAFVDEPLSPTLLSERWSELTRG